MEVRITITDGSVMAESLGSSPNGADAASRTPGTQTPLHLTGRGLPPSMSAAAASGASDAGPAPVELSVNQQGIPMPFITSTQQGASARSSMEADLPADESGGPASVLG